MDTMYIGLDANVSVSLQRTIIRASNLLAGIPKAPTFPAEPRARILCVNRVKKIQSAY